MDLLEYQAKELFREVGIPVPPSQYINDPRQMRQLALSYPLVLKSQVRAVGRARAGGIHFVENTIDAIAAARAIFSLPIRGQFPRLLLAEARYPVQQELFLAVAIDYRLQRPVLLGAAAQDLKGKGASKRLKKVTIDGDFSPFYARRLALAMGLQKEAIAAVSGAIAKMYYLWESKDLDCVEINPLGLNEGGEIMALDGKITVNDEAIARHPELLALAEAVQETEEKAAAAGSLHWFEKGGKIGILCNSLGAGMVLWDLLQQHKGKPAGCWAIGAATGDRVLDPREFAGAIATGLMQLQENPKIEVILIDLLASTVFLDAFVDRLLELHSSNELGARPRLVARLVGENAASAIAKRSRNDIARLESLPIIWEEDLDEAVARAISLS
ncbi:ATP-grasp domain-containing protein [Oscillatoria sp. FACHB-1406]|uniref:ATP-grasp domain-containing protein n=1 Tax=Oscillatoria sp. FACHB-1406 TaxID=2692846 RepID=UPI001684266D|nr:ATP-grasp domain-containing protein [Oscillatoria sp. FACHB-1406]MBD2579744.1 acetate--CoA ligase family protein [Oscillatoria sp. FACHB-1406]